MQTKKMNVFKVVSGFVLAILTILFVFPFYWILTGAFKSQPATIVIPPEWWPTSPTLENYGKLFTPNTLRWFFNSVFISVMTTFLVCATSALAGYALAKKNFPGVKIIFMVFVAAMALPKQVILIPLLNLITEFNLMNTYYALILPAVGWPFGVFLMRQFSQAIPTELLESARIDGAGFWVMLKNITLPLLKPTMIFVSTVALTNCFKLVDHIVIMTEGAPNNASTLLLYYIYQQGFTNFNYGKSSALTVIMLFLLLFVSLPRFFKQDREAYYN